jgi:DNA (cytosine-5)-methyltransferase 1
MEGNVRLLREKVIAGEMTEEEATQMLGKSPFDSQGKVKKMWPTPAARDYRGANGYEATQAKLQQGKRAQMGQLPNAVQMEEGRAIRGALNPTWVEWLMGFPLEWTDLKR